jgi:GNAT superfamily N-acetyltransferase
MMTIREAIYSEIPLLVTVAENVWERTYRHIIPPALVRLMMQEMHTSEAYHQQMNSGHRFFITELDGQVVGFVSFHPQKSDDGLVMRIPKLYVRFDCQGGGAGKALLNKVEREAEAMNIPYLELNVNRYNKALYFYRRNGFFIDRSEDIPYKGYWLNDYVLRRKCK